MPPFALGIGTNLADLGASFKPTQLSGCVLWLRADLGITIGTGVSAWADQSGNSNNFTQGTGASQPGYATTGNKLGTGPALTFNGTSQVLKLASFPLGNNTLSLFFTVKLNTLVATQSPIGFGNNAADAGWIASVDYGSTSKRELTLRGTAGTIADDSATTSWEEWTITRAGAGTAWTLSVNGVATSLSSSSDPAAQVGGSVIGAEEFGASANFLNGSMDEVIAYNRKVTAAEQAQVEAYIRARSAIW